MPRLSRKQYDVLCHLKYGGTLTGTRIYPGPWRYRTKEGNEVGESTVIALVQRLEACKSTYTKPPNESIVVTLLPRGEELEREFAAKRQDTRERGAQ